jgi:hypothetical protein
MGRIYCRCMGVERVTQLEQEFMVVKQLAANPLDLADYVHLKERLAAIAKEARQVIRTIHVTEPEWCRV